MRRSYHLLQVNAQQADYRIYGVLEDIGEDYNKPGARLSDKRCASEPRSEHIVQDMILLASHRGRARAR